MSDTIGGEGTANSLSENINKLTHENASNTCSYVFKYLAVKDVLKWTADNDMLAIPCQIATKKPIVELSRQFVDGVTPFHIPTCARVSILKDMLNNIDEVLENKTGINLALDTNVGWNNGKHLSFIDVDDKSYMEYFIKCFPTCPVVYGANGCKLLFFLEEQPKVSAYNIYNNKIGRIGEFYSSGTNRLCLIYGKHPNSMKTPDKPVYYKLDITNYIIPTFGKEFNELFSSCLTNENMMLEDITKTPNTNKNYTKPELTNKHNKKARSLTEFVGVSLSSLISAPEQFIGDGRIVKGSPFHSSESNTCFQADLDKDVWHCFQCNSGGGALEYLAVQFGIVNCSDCKGNILKNPYVRRTLVGRLIKEKYITDQEWVDYKLAQSRRGVL